MNTAVKNIADKLNVPHSEVMQILINQVEAAITAFREEIRLAKNVETLEFLRRTMWNNVFSENGHYYNICKKSQMLNIMRLNADLRYKELLDKKKKDEAQELVYNIIKTTLITPQSVGIRFTTFRRANEDEREREEVDGELVDSEIIY